MLQSYVCIYCQDRNKHTCVIQKKKLTLGKKGKENFALKSNRSVYLLHVDEGGNSNNFTLNIKEKNKYT